MIFGVGVSIDPKLDLIILGIMFDIANFTDSGQRDNKYVFWWFYWVQNVEFSQVIYLVYGKTVPNKWRGSIQKFFLVFVVLVFVNGQKV